MWPRNVVHHLSRTSLLTHSRIGPAKRSADAGDRMDRTMMKHLATGALSIVTAVLPALAQDTVPYTHRPITAGEPYVPGLGDIMGAIQWGHLKLSYAGKFGNWALASYELGQIQERLSSAARFYQNIPIEKIAMIEQPLRDLSDAIKAKDGPRFTRAFADLTNTCNSCHAAAGVGFITIQTPASSPFSNQSFGPKR